MNASDLTADQKRHLLQAIRDQIGTARYDELSRSYDEDTVIDLVLRTAGTAASSSGSSSGFPAEAKCFLLLWLLLSTGVGVFTSLGVGILFFVSPPLFLLLVNPNGIVLPTWLAVTLFVILVVGSVVVLDSYSIEEQNSAFGVVVIGGLVAWPVSWIARGVIRFLR